MFENLQLRFRKEKDGPEADLVKSFLSNDLDLFQSDGLNFCVLKEVYAEIGIPDILIVAWQGDITSSWLPARNKLDMDDIKILHHIAMNGKRGIRFVRITKELGYKEIELKKTINRLVAAELIIFSGTTATIVDLTTSFFLRKIISIEAKVDNWKKAIHQARVNVNFSSQSYILLPSEKINDRVLSYNEGNLGILAHSKNGAQFKIQAKKLKLPEFLLNFWNKFKELVTL